MLSLTKALRLLPLQHPGSWAGSAQVQGTDEWASCGFSKPAKGHRSLPPPGTLTQCPDFCAQHPCPESPASGVPAPPTPSGDTGQCTPPTTIGPPERHHERALAAVGGGGTPRWDGAGPGCLFRRFERQEGGCSRSRKAVSATEGGPGSSSVGTAACGGHSPPAAGCCILRA